MCRKSCYYKYLKTRVNANKHVLHCQTKFLMKDSETVNLISGVTALFCDTLS